MAAVFLLVAHAANADPVPILGLPLGGKLAKPLRVCPEGVYPVKALCWIDPPHKEKGGALSGAVDLPNPDSRPMWAAYAAFTLWIGDDGQIDTISVMADTRSGTTRSQIADSISARFGPPSETTKYGARWNSAGITIGMLCSPGEWCRVGFSLARAEARGALEAATRKQREAKRPVSP